MSTDWYLGTMGFSYSDWSGNFYPEGLASRQYLAHYSRIFNAVEIDSTFYGPPRPEQVQRWADMTPEEFKFCPKTPRAITHEGRLLVSEEMDTFLETMRLLGDKLGVVLIQFPPGFATDQSPVLVKFLARLPADLRYAVEFRHRSWYVPDTAAMLAEAQVCWASTAYADLPQVLQPTTDFLYIRWIGQHGRFKRHERQELNPGPNLQNWWERIQAYLDRVNTVYGFFNNDYAGHAPTTCNQFKDLVGLPVTPAQFPQQGRLL